jgi:hypothetical protein
MTEPKHIRLLGSRSRIVLDDGAVAKAWVYIASVQILVIRFGLINT